MIPPIYKANLQKTHNTHNKNKNKNNEKIAKVNLRFSIGILFKDNFLIICPNIDKPIGFFSLF